MPDYLDLEAWGCDEDSGLPGKPCIEDLIAAVVQWPASSHQIHGQGTAIITTGDTVQFVHACNRLNGQPTEMASQVAAC